MKRFFFLLLLSLFVGAWIFQMLENHPVYLLVHSEHTNIEINLWFAVGVMLLVAFIVWLAVKIFKGGVLGTAARVKRLFVSSELRAQKKTAKGLVSFVEGDWKQAYRLLVQSAPKAQMPLVNYLAASRSAYELGDRKEALELLAKAEASSPNAELAVSLTQAKMQLLAKRFEQCGATLQRASKVAPNHPVVLDLLCQVYVNLEDWYGLQAILPQLLKSKSLTEDKKQDLQLSLYRNLLAQAGREVDITNSDSTEHSLENTWKKTPSQWQRNAEVVLSYCEALIQQGQAEKAGEWLRKTLNKNWHDSLILKYGLLELNDSHRQLLQAEKWLKERPGNSVLLLTLGRLCLRNKEWDKGRFYFGSSLNIQGSTAACAEMARLLNYQGEYQQSLDYYQQGLALTSDALPELPMPSPSN